LATAVQKDEQERSVCVFLFISEGLDDQIKLLTDLRVIKQQLANGHTRNTTHNHHTTTHNTQPAST